jgi:hypothetical protein
VPSGEEPHWLDCGCAGGGAGGGSRRRGRVLGLAPLDQQRPDLLGGLGVLLHPLAGVLAALGDALSLPGVVGADFSMTPASLPRSTISPAQFTPVPYKISNSASRKGGAILFFTTLTRVFVPTTVSPFLTTPILRMSRRTDA